MPPSASFRAEEMSKKLDPKKLLTDLRAGRIPKKDLYSVIHTLGHEDYLEAKADVEQFLTHPNSELRYIALNVLTFHWMCDEHRTTCEQFLLHDRDSDNRRMGVAGLGALMERTKDPKTLSLLLRVFRNKKEEWDVRDVAYQSILYVLGRPASEQPSSARLLDYAKDVNWDRIREAETIVHTVKAKTEASRRVPGSRERQRRT